MTDEEGHYRFQTNVWDGEVIGDGLMVTENSPLGMSVLVNGGDAKVPYLDYAYTVWIPDGSPEQATITTADPTNPRIDRVVLYVDRAETPQQVNPNNPSIPKIAVVAGTPGAVPVRPTDGAVDTAVSNNPWIDLADVLVGAGVTQVTDSNITDTRVPITITADKLNLESYDDDGWDLYDLGGLKIHTARFGRTASSVSSGGVSNLTSISLPSGVDRQNVRVIWSHAVANGDSNRWAFTLNTDVASSGSTLTFQIRNLSGSTANLECYITIMLMTP